MLNAEFHYRFVENEAGPYRDDGNTGRCTAPYHRGPFPTHLSRGIPRLFLTNSCRKRYQKGVPLESASSPLSGGPFGSPDRGGKVPVRLENSDDDGDFSHRKVPRHRPCGYLAVPLPSETGSRWFDPETWVFLVPEGPTW